MRDEKRTLRVGKHELPLLIRHDSEDGVYSDIEISSGPFRVVIGISQFWDEGYQARVMVESKTTPDRDEFDCEDFYMVYDL